MLRIADFKKSYNQHPVLAVPSLELGAGIHWIKGVNGSGKSTLLKAIAGIIDFSGDILLDNVSIRQQPVDYRKKVNFAEAEPVFPEFLTGREMIRLFATAKQAPAGQEVPYLESMQMQSYLDQPLGSYSSGMLKKLSLVLAFTGTPRLILLDEPLITLDTASLDILYNWIRERYTAQGTSFLLSSHQPIEQDALVVNSVLLTADKTVKQLAG
ncbi:ABC transporter ATP-binding protein [Chitinophaga pinensis]|uniref:ABC transporter related n=1 Tax=Chitinophaga pinensis (strain ATCC 43595 / DSM 2588 / LMG 13176 / NBRC 15968 / NCIMB 11800 / UQM 2034) TaxID=485918 RepID=A0A979G9L7_CHIPD|nr:ATP-binding cassette domain-containing protein [Chitinophaga pinensis]ACU63158.1 ABC transporter related [Chitinophaga pinensis DSM 2588]